MLGDTRPAQFAKLEKLLVTYALSRKQTKVAIIIEINTPLGTIGNQTPGSQGAHIIVNNESLGRKSYTIDQMLGAHPINHPIWNLNSTMSDEEEDVN